RDFGFRHGWKATLAFAVALLAGAFWTGAAGPVDEVRRQMVELRREISRHDEAYANATPEINDHDYDQLKRRLAALEEQFPDVAGSLPALPGIADDRSGRFRTVRHRERMLSLDKAYTEAELGAFHARLAKRLGREDLVYVVEPKF